MTRTREIESPIEIVIGIPGEFGVAEVALLLPVEHLAALEQAAHRHGLTAAQLLRRLVRDLVAPDAVQCPSQHDPDWRRSGQTSPQPLL